MGLSPDLVGVCSPGLCRPEPQPRRRASLDLRRGWGEDICLVPRSKSGCVSLRLGAIELWEELGSCRGIQTCSTPGF